MNDQERKWHRDQCKNYKKELPIYTVYAGTLEEILKAMCRENAPSAIVQARPKSFSSFAEKLARKAKKYMALSTGPTDLCGARVITETLTEVERICTEIRKVFAVDDKNSLDTIERLKTEEFGYRSVHYVVQCKGPKAYGIRVPTSIGDRKAEIQVRTLLQHAYASIGHDRFYKSSLHVQESLKRQMARVAALLEEGDATFGSCVSVLDSYETNYGAYMSRSRLDEEQGILRELLQNESDDEQKAKTALRLAQLARSTGDYKRVAEILKTFLKVKCRFQAELIAEHGHALCRVHSSTPKDHRFMTGLNELHLALNRAPENLTPRILGYVAWVQSQIPDQERIARDAYRAALNADPSNPFHLASFTEYEMSLGEKLGPLSIYAPRVEQAIQKCRDHINAEIEVPWSFLTMGRLWLLLGKTSESLLAYTKAIHLALAVDSTVPVSALDAELTFLRRINRGRDFPHSHRLVRQMLLLAKRVKTGLGAPELQALRSSFKIPVTILAGGTALKFQENVKRFRGVILEAFSQFAGTIISGGTRIGVAGLAGDIAGNRKRSERGALDVLGYIPTNLPHDEPSDSRYTDLVPSDEPIYGPGHIVQYWTDLLLAGIKPEDVRVLGIDGGPIASLEYRLALAYGASVGLMEPATREAAVLLSDPDWRACAFLIGLPADRKTVQAFVQPLKSRLSPKYVENIAQKVHQAYVEEKLDKNPAPPMRPWKNLDDEYKQSNRMQAAGIASLLERAGFIVEPASHDRTLTVFTNAEIETLAELEHGRWVVERAQTGWHFGEERSEENKFHPNLVPWKTLPHAVKEIDRQAVTIWPALLAQAGLRVARRRK